MKRRKGLSFWVSSDQSSLLVDVELLIREVQKGDRCEGVVAKSSTEILLGNVD